MPISEDTNPGLPAPEPFDYADYFTPDDDPGVQVTISARGRSVPMRIKRNITQADFSRAMTKAVQYEKDQDGQIKQDKQGSPVVAGVDEGAFAQGLLATCILSWPFTRDGKPLPINEQTVASLNAEVSIPLQLRVMAQIRELQNTLGPLGQLSGAA